MEEFCICFLNFDFKIISEMIRSFKLLSFIFISNKICLTKFDDRDAIEVVRIINYIIVYIFVFAVSYLIILYVLYCIYCEYNNSCCAYNSYFLYCAIYIVKL